MEKCKDNMVNPSLSGITRSYFKEWLKNKKKTNSISWVLFFKCFHKIFNFFSYLSIACLSIWFEAYFGKTNVKIVKKCTLNSDGPFKNHIF
jgi:hypothetical protein